MVKVGVSLGTMETMMHEEGFMEMARVLHKNGKVQYREWADVGCLAEVDDEGVICQVFVVFTKDGSDLEGHFCSCAVGRNGEWLCRHIAATVLAVQGGAYQPELVVGKAGYTNMMVNESNTAKTIGSGSMDVLATPMMIALMEQAACDCLKDCLAPGQTSVGTMMNVSHLAATPIGMEVSATARIEHVFGRTIEFVVIARDRSGDVGRGSHTRVIVDEKRFMEKFR